MVGDRHTNKGRQGAPIGIVDLQGGVVEHIDHLARIGIDALRIKKPEDIVSELAGLIIPGGESTCLAHLFATSGLQDEVQRLFYEEKVKIWGTCAGAILVAKRIVGEVPKLAFIDIDIERNAFGTQLDSFVTRASVPEVAADEVPLTFIRAPKIRAAGPDVKVLLRQRGYIAMAENENVLVTVFHPELTPCLDFHRYFARKCGLSPGQQTQASQSSPWSATSWTRHVQV